MLLQLLAVWQAGEEVVLGHAQQAVFRLVTQVGVAFDGGQQLVGGIDPDPQLVLLVALEQGQLVFAGAVGVDGGQVLDDSRQRLGQQPVIDQVQHQAHGQGPQDSGNEDDHRTDDEALAISGGVEGDAQVAVIFAVGATAHQLRSEGAFLTEDQVGQPAAGGFLQVAGFLREHGLVRVANGGHAHSVILEQAFNDLHAHFPVQAVDRLCRWVAKHVENALGIASYRLPSLVGIEDDLGAAQDHAHYECRQQHNPEQLHRQAVFEFQLQRAIPCSVRVASSCHEYWQSRDGRQSDISAENRMSAGQARVIRIRIARAVDSVSVATPCNLRGGVVFYLP